ncbi:MAG: DUF305 domain-containing protein [Lachnospiraceae bacterium]|nr:DUF305 domain-containing protein [Lachnospiraceae bacterium]
MTRTVNNQSCFSRVTEKYLDTFNCILNRMIEGMTCAELTNSISHNFIVQMIPHHRAAIEMSENILQYTTNLTIEEIAENIICEQTRSIADMEAILSCCGNMSNSRESVCRYQSQIEPVFNTMFNRMRTAKATNDINCCFLREMLPHHEGAVAFSEITLRQNICPQLVPILDSIITSQKRGICQMERLLDTLCC